MPKSEQSYFVSVLCFSLPALLGFLLLAQKYCVIKSDFFSLLHILIHIFVPHWSLSSFPLYMWEIKFWLKLIQNFLRACLGLIFVYWREKKV